MILFGLVLRVEIVLVLLISHIKLSFLDFKNLKYSFETFISSIFFTTSFILLSIKAIDSGVLFLTELTIPSQIISERSLAFFFKARKLSKIRSPLILISSENILKKQMKKLKVKNKINLLNYKNFDFEKLNNKSINLINIDFDQKKPFQKISKKSNKFIEKSFQIAFEIIKKEKIYKFINGPISKKHFLGNKYLGITEYISKKFSVKKNCMLIYNKKLSVCPVTTHLPLKQVSKNISKKKFRIALN